ncbi:carotenoid 1,2-hydratase [Vibrio sp. JC009]|uniref:lipocalin-like domain-containing protein n=1 Tax=Vibrio sp. JC009 TaxID=2912314 RepID=UPI0023B10C72|nr:lipocalin-like domain-containing protein [Vibrio sp. JC009]WED22893.1 carotenoid 1,2-hydratase [Vibrio sp. JC009]
MKRLIYLLAITLFVSACSEPEPSKSMGSLLAGDLSGYSKVIPGKALSFPFDHRAHPEFRQEWWYLTANLQTENGEKLGLQWTQFRIALSPDPDEQTNNGGWETNQLYMAHTAVTTGDKHLANEKWSRQHRQMAYVLPEPFSIKLDNWRWQSTGKDLFPAELTVSSDEFNYRLSLTSTSPLQLQGDNGYSIKSADGKSASYYYSQPFIDVQGELVIDGVAHQVTGKAWLDREWSSQVLSRSQQGWDWFGLRLDDGSALMLFQLRSSEDKSRNFYSARRMYPDGKGINIASDEIEVVPADFHKIKGTPYPIAWDIRIPSGQIEIRAEALNPNAKMPLTIPYWEGPVLVSGSHSGEGYMELTGY